jgi:predicted cupin superfamily sugar epimerase
LPRRCERSARRLDLEAGTVQVARVRRIRRTIHPIPRQERDALEGDGRDAVGHAVSRRGEGAGVKPLSAADVIQALGLVPLEIEGGWFRETYRSAGTLPASALPPLYGGPRALATAIYYLLTPETFSEMHRVRSDEVFHFYAGDPVELLMLPDGDDGVMIKLGNDLAAGHVPQLVVPAGTWQGSRLAAGGAWALLGTTVSPGFDYADYERGERVGLEARWPRWAEAIAARAR